VESYAEVTESTLTTNFMFELPLDRYPQLSTDLVEVQWSLGFEFITAKQPIALQNDASPNSCNNCYKDIRCCSNSQDSLAEADGADVEQFDWTLPLRVLVPYYPNEVDTRCRKTQDPKTLLSL